MSERAKRVFLSYAWESDEHRQWVRRLAARLCKDGVNARLDAWHLRGTDQISHFMNREVREADFILVICTPAYQQKVQETEDGGRTRGVAWEMLLATSRVLNGEPNKALAVLARGAWSEAAPAFVSNLPYFDLSDPACYEAKYQDLLREIKGTIEQAPPVGGVFDVQLLFSLEAPAEEGGGWSVSLQIEDGEPVRAPFELDLAPDGQTAHDLQVIAKDTCTADDIQNLGSELWTKLLGGSIKEEVERARRQCRDQEGTLKIRLHTPPEWEDFPWESISDYAEGALGTSPLTSVVRSLAGGTSGSPQRHEIGPPLKMLVVIPEGSGLRTASEWERIHHAAEAAGPSRVVLECLDGPVTLEGLERKLGEVWNIVHFIGHGQLRGERFELRLNREGEGEGETVAWVGARLFAQQFRGKHTDLVVMNCCHAGSLNAQALSGLSDYLARTGSVTAVLGMRYAVHDSAASEFAAAFYQELFTGAQPGRIDLAVQRGRRTLENLYSQGNRARNMITPVLHLAAGCEKPFALPPFEPEKNPKKSKGEEPGAGTRRTGAPVDRRLLSAIESRCCLPILGPGILAAGAERQQQAIPPSPGGLAQQLARQSDFPGFERLTPLTDSEADWLTPVLFERVCQHFESVAPGERRDLDQAIRNAYQGFEPPPALDQISSWGAPGVVYTFVDGLLEKSLRRLPGSDPRVVQTENLGAFPSAGGDFVLLNLRGSYMDAPSMALTEADEDRLLDRMPDIATFVENLMNRHFHCVLLFLGVSARDPLVRALARRLLRDDVAKHRGTAFFVSDHTTPADQAYWYQFSKLEWLDLDTDRVIEELAQAARKDGTPGEGS